MDNASFELDPNSVKTGKGLVRPNTATEAKKTNTDEKTTALIQQALYGGDDFKFHTGDDLEDGRW